MVIDMKEEEIYSLPLFPLNMVLFPFSRVQLHIFEQRYRQMIRFCLDNDQPFGIVMIRTGEEVEGEAEPYLIGTAVRIMDVYHFPDGRMDITVLGTERFRIREFDASLPYLRGFVQPIGDGARAETDVEMQQLTNLARNYSDAMLRQLIDSTEFNASFVFPEDPEKLSFAIASMLDLPLIRKQVLLESTDTFDRLEQLVAILEHFLHRNRLSERKLSATDLKDWVSPN
jgi:Lon protease-like protein